MKSNSKISRKEAAQRIMVLYNNYEVRKVTFKTIYNQVFFSPVTSSWRLIGYAHDYTV